MKINGYSIPLKDIITIGAGFMWLGALSWQVNANGDEIQEQSETKERLVRLEEREGTTKQDIRDIKAIQQAQAAEQIAQGKILAEILVKVSKK